MIEKARDAYALVQRVVRNDFSSRASLRLLAKGSQFILIWRAPFGRDLPHVLLNPGGPLNTLISSPPSAQGASPLRQLARETTPTKQVAL